MAGASKGQPRWLFLVGGLAAAVLFLGLLHLVLGKNDTSAMLLLDWHDDSVFYNTVPGFSIQNVMWLVFFVGLGDLVYRYLGAIREERFRNLKLLPEDDRTVLVVADLTDIRRKTLEAGKDQRGFVVELVDECILRFQSSKSIDQTHNVLSSMMDLQLHRLDLRYTLLRYVSWLLPTIGFIGTVVGIAVTLKHLSGGSDDVSGDISALAGTLGVAFYTTMLALMQSGVLVGLIHLVQQREETVLNQAAEYCLRNLIDRLYLPSQGR